MKISSRTAQTKRKTQILVIWKTDMCNRKFKTSELNPMIPIFFEDKKNKNPKDILSVYNAKISSRLTRLFS